MFQCLSLMQIVNVVQLTPQVQLIPHRIVVQNCRRSRTQIWRQLKSGPNSHARGGFRNKYRRGRRSGSDPDFGDYPLESSSELSCRLL